MNDKHSVEQASATTQAGISRRDLLLGTGALAGLAMAGSAAAQTMQHDHSKHTAQQPDLLVAVNDCLDKGRRCTSHCLVVFQEGDTSLAKCAAKVNEMHAVCEAFSVLLSANSTYSKDYAALCSRVCADCEKECREHEKHVECRACAEACAEVIASIKFTFG